MKKLALILVGMFLCSALSFGQKSNEIVFSFIKKDSEKVMQKANDGTQFVNFTISGIQTDEQAKILADGIKLNDIILEFTISDETSPLVRNAYLKAKREVKFEQLRELMKANNVAFVKVNDVLTPLSELKTKAEKRAEKAKDKSKP
jgi:hypothetical protein